MSKIRLDQLVLENGFATSREKAKALIMEGIVFVDNQKEDKPGSMFDEKSNIEVRGKVMPYVSRGGFKLEKALNTFPITLEGKICGDIGSSTGGFTDCMLQNGAKKVYAIDVGRGQLDYKLRCDDRVVSMEKTNIRYVKEDDIADKFDFASIDVSFISLKLVLPALYNLLNDNSEVVALIKPQFEAGREKVGKGGVVREKSTHIEVIENVFNYALSSNFKVIGLTYSPIKGPNGNIEYLVHLLKNSKSDENIKTDNEKYLTYYKLVVEEAFEKL